MVEFSRDLVDLLRHVFDVRAEAVSAETRAFVDRHRNAPYRVADPALGDIV
jgi:hypothetical protein